MAEELDTVATTGTPAPINLSPEPLARLTARIAMLDTELGYHQHLRARFALHPAVVMLLNAGHEPDHYAELIEQWPHASTDQPHRLAYTKDRDRGERDIQTRLDVGTYLMRHFSVMRDWFQD